MCAYCSTVQTEDYYFKIKFLFQDDTINTSLKQYKFNNFPMSLLPIPFPGKYTISPQIRGFCTHRFNQPGIENI